MLTDVALCGEVQARTLLAPLPNGLATQLFAYLVLHRRRPVPHAALVDALWVSACPRDPRAVLSSLLSRLRRSLGADVLPVGPAVRLVLPPGASVDIDEAELALVAARAALECGDAAGARGQAERAREIAGRGLLVDFDARWIDPWRTDVESTHLDALELLARAGAQLGGDHAREGERAARHAIARAPLRESAHAALMEVLAALDEGAAALQVYEQLRRSLDAELGAVPSTPVRELHQRLLTAPTAGSTGPLAGASASPATPPATATAGSTWPVADASASAALASTDTTAPLPTRPGASLEGRLEELGPATAAVVERAAVLGEVAAVELLLELDGDVDRLSALARLQRTFDAGLLAPAPSWLGPAVRFPHPPDAALALAGLPATAPPQIAATALGILRESDGDGVAIARLGLRAVPAIPRDEAVSLAREGIAMLLRGRAFTQAAELAERALTVGPGRHDRVALLLDLGRALRHEDPDRAWRVAASAYAAARELDDPALLARAALATGATGAGERTTHSDGALARRLREALDRLPAEEANAAPASPAAPARATPAPATPAPTTPPPLLPATALDLRTRLIARLALDRSWSDPEEAEPIAAQARRAATAATGAARAAGRDLPLRTHAHVELARIGASRGPERTHQRLELADMLAARARAEGDRGVELAALLQGLPLLGELGRAAAVGESVARIEQLGRALADPRALRVAGDVRAVAAALAETPTAPAPANAPPATARPPSPAHAAPNTAATAPPTAPTTTPDDEPHGWRRIRLRLAQGTVAAVLGEVDDLVRLEPSLDGPRALSALARLLAGDAEEATARLHRSSPDELPRLALAEGGQLHAWCALGLVAARTGEREHAVALHDLLEPFAGRHAVAPCSTYLTPVARVLGELAGALGRPQEARERFRLAVSQAETIGATATAEAIRRELDGYARPQRDRV